MAEELAGDVSKKGGIAKKPQEQIAYTGQYPDLPEFQKPLEFCIPVGQGSGKLSLDGKPLTSDGFSDCSALILKNRISGQSALFHIDAFDLGGEQTPVVQEFMRGYILNLPMDSEVKDRLLLAALEVSKYMYPKTMKREEFQKRMEELNLDGALKAQYIVGNDGRNVKNRIMGSLLNYLGIKAEDDIMVDSEKRHWGLVYKPKESKVFVRNRQTLSIYNF